MPTIRVVNGGDIVMFPISVHVVPLFFPEVVVQLYFGLAGTMRCLFVFLPCELIFVSETWSRTHLLVPVVVFVSLMTSGVGGRRLLPRGGFIKWL